MSTSIRITSDLGRLMNHANSTIGQELKEAVRQGIEFGAREIKSGLSSSRSQSRTKSLAASFKTRIEGDGRSSLRGEAASTKRYAKIQDEGGTITAKKQYLAIPITPTAQRMGPKKFPAPLVFIHRPPHLPVLAKISTNARGKERIKPQYLLVRSVRITGKHYIAKASERTAQQIDGLIQAAVSRAFSVK